MTPKTQFCPNGLLSAFHCQLNYVKMTSCHFHHESIHHFLEIFNIWLLLSLIKGKSPTLLYLVFAFVHCSFDCSTASPTKITIFFCPARLNLIIKFSSNSHSRSEYIRIRLRSSMKWCNYQNLINSPRIRPIIIFNFSNSIILSFPFLILFLLFLESQFSRIIH